MPPSSDSISSTSLPLGIDNHIHASLRRSGSLPHSAHHEFKSDALNANAHASDAVYGHSNPRIPPSSIHNIPRSHKICLRQHRILFWVLTGVFSISIIALTAAIVFGAVESHQHGRSGATCAAIIVGVFGFSSMIGSAAVIWLIVTGRRARVRLERRWADEERVKEARGMREHQRESQIRESIKDRERSLSRSRSRGRDRDRMTGPAVAKKLSSRAKTPAPSTFSQRSDHSSSSASGRRDSLWPRPLNVSKDVLEDLNDAVDEKKQKDYEHDGNDDCDKDEHDDRNGHHEGRKAPVMQKLRISVSTQSQDLDPSDSEDVNRKAETASRPITVILNEEDASEVSPHVDHSKSLPLLPDSGHASLTPLESSFTYIDSAHTDSYPNPLVPYNTPQLDSSNQSPPTTVLLRSNGSNTETPRDDDNDDDDDDDDTPPHIPRLKHGGLGSAQSDENFQAMLEHEDGAGSEDEKDRQSKRKQIRQRVEAWASTTSLGGGEGGERQKEDRGKKLRDAVGSGLQKVATRKKGRM